MHSKNKKRWLSSGLLAAALAVTSCLGLGGLPKSARAASVHLTFLTWFSSAQAKAFNAAIKDFEQKLKSVLGSSASTAPGAAPRHWLQVNNIHLADQPVWLLG